MSHPFRILVLSCVVALLAVPILSEAQRVIPWWPTTGAVILEGGHVELRTFDEFAKRLIALAGGPNALIVIIPTANESVAPRLRGTGPPFDPNELKTLLASKGAHRVTVLHTRDRQVANSPQFAQVLRSASGVWVPGGGEGILENTYRGTLVAIELRALLARGGVIAGDSAGATTIGRFELGWKPPSFIFQIVVNGLSILPNATIVPHSNIARGYVPSHETLKYLVAHPGPVGVVIDENTALVLKGSAAEVIGTGQVALVDPTRDKAKPYLVLNAGDTRDLAK